MNSYLVESAIGAPDFHHQFLHLPVAPSRTGARHREPEGEGRGQEEAGEREGRPRCHWRLPLVPLPPHGRPSRTRACRAAEQPGREAAGGRAGRRRRHCGRLPGFVEAPPPPSRSLARTFARSLARSLSLSRSLLSFAPLLTGNEMKPKGTKRADRAVGLSRSECKH
uniref:Uncharacterized protein n=1 Tax=Monodelphis domestica TaxID=13616 RepID=A0A5F8GLP0_MONDO